MSRSGSESWIQVEVGEETVELYYLLDVMNMAQVPVEPEAPIVFDLPSSAQSATVLAGSAPDTRVDGRRVELPGPFQPGSTPLRVGVQPVSFGQQPRDLTAVPGRPRVVAGVCGEVGRDGHRVRPDLSPWRDEPGGIGRRHVSACLGPAYPDGRSAVVRADRAASPQLGAVDDGIGPGCRDSRAWDLGSGGTGGLDGGRTEPAGRRGQEGEAVHRPREGRASARRGKIGSTKYSSRRRELIAALEQVYRELDEAPTAAVLQSARMVPSGSPAPGL